MIKHIVLLDLPESYDANELVAIMDGLAGLRDVIDGFFDFSHGPNKDFEGASLNCAYAFVCDFADETTSRVYLANATHAALGGRLVAMCNGGADGITVIDMACAA